MNYFIEPFKKYAVFSGRARRKEYWMFTLFNIFVVFILGIIEGVLAIGSGSSGRGPLVSIYQLVILVPSVAVCIRRMHDVDKSGWYSLIPIYNLILALTGGTKGPNKYGPDPKETKTS